MHSRTDSYIQSGCTRRDIRQAMTNTQGFRKQGISNAAGKQRSLLSTRAVHLHCTLVLYICTAGKQTRQPASETPSPQIQPNKRRALLHTRCSEPSPQMFLPPKPSAVRMVPPKTRAAHPVLIQRGDAILHHAIFAANWLLSGTPQAGQIHSPSGMRDRGGCRQKVW